MTRRPASHAERREARAAVDDPAVVLEAALRFLEPRARSVAEVRTRLVRAGYRAELVDAAIERLLEIGMLDDEAFARSWVESRDRAHPRGTSALRGELRRKGVTDELARTVLADRDGEATGGPDEAGGSADERAAERLLARRAAALSRIADPRERRRRAYALLARSGFDPDTCARLARTVGGVDDGLADPG